MDENEGVQSQEEDVEAHLLKETAAAAVAVGTLIAGASSAQARIIEPNPGAQDQATLTQKSSTKPAKKTTKKAVTHQRQRNRADTIEP